MKIQNHTFLTILAASLLLFSASCNKKAEKAPELQPSAEASQGNEAENAAAPAKDLRKIEPETAVNMPDTHSQTMAPGLSDSPSDASSHKPVSPKVQAAFDNLFYVMEAIGNAGNKGSCTEILSELKKINEDPLIKEKLINAKTIKDYPSDIQDSIYQANRLRLINLTMQFASFNKCNEKPEGKEIVMILRSIFEPLDDRLMLSADKSLKNNDQFANDLNDDDDEENDEKEEDCDDKCLDEWLNEINDLVEFGRRHEIQGDMSEVKWADLEPTLPVSILKVSPDNDVIKKLESMFKYNCGIDDSKTAADGTSVQLIVCSKKDADVKDKDDEVETSRGHYYNKNESDCPHETADVAYLGLLNPKDRHTRVYKIDSNLDLGYECSSESDSGSLTLSDVEFRPFMDTIGVYVRIYSRSTHDVVHSDLDHDIDSGKNYVTWLFAGSKHRLVTHWVDTSYYYSVEEYDGCHGSNYSAQYKENYMYYNSGKFETVTRTAKSEEELKELISKRP